MTGGGTGGHVNPALAIANTIAQNEPGSEMLFVGTEHGIENKLTAAAGYPIRHVKIAGFKRSLSLKNIKAAYLAFVSPMRAKKIVREFKPDIVIGTGGYVCWPVLVAASKMGIPTAVHESNAFPGVAVRKLQPYVDAIWLNFAESEKYLTAKDKILRVGNPLRGDFGAIEREEARKKLGIDGKYEHFILSTPWIASSIALLLVSGSAWYYKQYRKRGGAAKNSSDTWATDWERAKQAFASTASGHLMLAAIHNDTFTHEQRKMLLSDIESSFTSIILRLNQEAPHVNREEVLYCICSGLHVAPRRIADCLLTTPSTLRSRKSRLSGKLPEYMYDTFFTKRESKS